MPTPKRVLVLVPFPMDADNLAKRRAQMSAVKLGPDIAFDFRPVAIAPVNYVSQQDLDQAEATYKPALASIKEAEAQVKTAKINLNYTDVKSPISGRIGISAVTAGALVTANHPSVIPHRTQHIHKRSRKVRTEALLRIKPKSIDAAALR